MAKGKAYSTGAASSKAVVVTAISVIALVAVTGAVFAATNLSILKPKASSLTPTVTRRYTENFKEGAQVDLTNWNINRVPVTESSIGIYQSTTDNLRINLPAGKTAALWGGLTKKETVQALGDFSSYLVVYHPEVKGKGAGRVGIRFASADSENGENAGVYWVATEDGKNEKMVFYVNDANSKRKVTQSVTIDPKKVKVAVIRLDRINNSYVAYMKPNADLTADTAWVSVGKCIDDVLTHCNKGLGKAGKIAIYAYNAVEKNLFPQVIARIDTAIMRWEDSSVKPPTVKSYGDAFANDAIAKSWKVENSTGVVVSENKTENLVIALPNTSATTKKVAYAYIKRLEPVVGVEKSFAVSATVYKPIVATVGSGYVGVSFASTTAANKEAASVRWIASATDKLTSAKNTSRVVFYVTDRAGNNVEKASVALPATTGKVILHLVRTVTETKIQYRAYYRTGVDGDTNWLPIGDSAVESTLGEAGTVFLTASNMGAKVNGEVKFPAVKARIDQIYGSVSD